MNDPRIDKLAGILVRYSCAVKPKELVGLSGYPFSTEAMPLMEAVLLEILHAGGNPVPYMELQATEGFDRILFNEASDDQLRFRAPWVEQMIQSLDCDIGIMAPTNTRRLSKCDGSRIALHASSRADLAALYMKRAAAGSLRWVLCSTPTAAYAQDAEMSLPEYQEFLFAATHADQDDPISFWEDLARSQSALADRLSGKRELVVQSPHVDLAFSVEGRTFISCDGKINMPDGEIFTGPVEDSASGWIESTFPAMFKGVDVGRVRLVFKQGRVIEADAERHQDHLNAMLDSDAGARRLGEFGVGTNGQIKVFSNNMLFDEKIGGTVHFAVGAGYPESGSLNESGIHWDFLCDMRDGGIIAADGALIYEAGKFTV